MYKRREDSVRILIVDDEPGHARLIEKNLRRSGISNQIIKLENGKLALDYIFREGEFENRESRAPLFMLLDLNMPVMDGFQVLKRLKQDDKAKHIPIVILTTAENQHEIEKCYKLGCNIFISKPIEYDEFADAMRKVGLFLSVVRLPQEM